MVGRLSLPKAFPLLAVLTLALGFGSAWAESKTPPGDPPAKPGTCLSKEEAELAKLVQEYRKAHGLPAVPLSTSLSLVAKWHAIDLEKNQPHRTKNPQGEPCDPHSWSSKGPWTAVCYTPDAREARRIADKPREITGGRYRGAGFENVYYTSEEVLPFRVLDYWKIKPAENMMLLEMDDWAGAKWAALGVGIYKHYAVLWLGAVTDPQGTIAACGPK